MGLQGGDPGHLPLLTLRGPPLGPGVPKEAQPQSRFALLHPCSLCRRKKFRYPSPKSKKMAMVCPRVPRCPLGSAPRRLVLELKLHFPFLCPPKADPCRIIFPACCTSFAGWLCGLSWGAGLGWKAPPPPPFSLQRGWGLQREVRGLLTHPRKPDSPSPPERTLRTGLESWDSGWEPGLGCQGLLERSSVAWCLKPYL